MMIDDCVPVAPWRGPIVCVASGPSLDLRQVRRIGMARAQDKIRVIAVNDAVYPCWFADVLHACDKRFWQLHGGVQGFRGHKTSLEIAGYPDVRTLKNTGITGFDPEPGAIRSGANGGYQAVHLAAKIWRPTTIVLVGYDYTDDGARDHYFGKHLGDMDKASNVKNWRLHLKELTDILGARDVRFANASTKSTINWLPRVSLDDLNWGKL